MIRFYLIALFFLISLLSFCKAPEYHLWLLAIGVEEFPLLFAGITALLTLSGIWVQKYQLAGTVLGLITLIIFLSPIFRAYGVSKDIKQKMSQALGGSIIADSSPVVSYGFSVLKLFSFGYHDNEYATWFPTPLQYISDVCGIAQRLVMYVS